MPIPFTSIRHAQVIMYGSRAAQGSSAINTVTIFNYRRTATVVTPSKAALDTIFQSTVADKVVLALNNTWSQQYNTIRYIDDALDGPLSFTHVNAGAVAGDSMSSINTIAIDYRTALRGKSYRGKNLFGPLSEADTTAGASDILNAAAITRFAAVVTGLETALVDSTGNTWVLEVLSRINSNIVTNPTSIVANDVTQVRLNKRIGRNVRRAVASLF